MTKLRARFIEELKLAGMAPTTVESYVGSVRRLAAHFGRSPALLTDEEVRSYQVYLVDVRKCAASTFNVSVSALRFFYARVLGRSIPTLKCQKRDRRLPVVLNHGETGRLLEQVRNARVRTALGTMYGCGLRISEVLALRVSDIDGERKMLTVRQGKGRKGRTVPIADWNLSLLRSYWVMERPTEWLFPSRHRPGPLHPSTIQKAFKGALRSAGIDKPATVHSLRHSYATHLLDLGVSIRAVQELLGHRSVSTTMRYLHVTSRTADQVSRALEEMGASVGASPVL